MHFLENSMFVLTLIFVVNQDLSRFYAPNSDFYSEIQELTQILLRISEEKIGGWGLCSQDWKTCTTNQRIPSEGHASVQGWWIPALASLSFPCAWRFSRKILVLADW